MVEMEIVSVGNELLIGKTLNTNAYWIAKLSTSHGMTVRRITVVGDDVNCISAVIRETVKRKPKFIVTTGGLGPTFDDKTLEGIANALSQKLEINQNALRMVKEKYKALVEKGKMKKMELTPARTKMAKLPNTAQPLPNPVGTAPAVIMKKDETLIIALPGVPSEMKSIFKESVVPLLRKESGTLAFFETSVFADNIMESVLAPLIDLTMRENTCVYIKSHPKGEEDKPHIELHFSTMAKQPKTARKHLTRAVHQLSEFVAKNGGSIRSKRRAP